MKYIPTLTLLIAAIVFALGCKQNAAQKTGGKSNDSQQQLVSDSHDHGHDHSNDDYDSAHDDHDHAHDNHDHAHDDQDRALDEAAHEDDTRAVTFSRALQQQLDFETQPAAKRVLSNNIRAIGEIKAAGVGEAEVFAPFDGVLMPDPTHGIVRPGQEVTKGEILARIAPSGGPESGWTQLINEYRLSKAEYDRVKGLAADGAVSAKRLQEAELDFETKRSRIRGAIGEREADIDEIVAEGDFFNLRAPASGVINDIHLRFGQHVETGEHLFNIIDPSWIWLEVQVPASESGSLSQVYDATFTLTGSNEIYRVSDLDGRLVTVGTLLDPITRRVPVIFEMRNTNSLFRPGSFAKVNLKTMTQIETLAIPETALIDEDDMYVVYVQTGPEAFERRVVRTGLRDGGFVEITDGLTEGDTVVTIGAYKIRLASLKITPEEAGHHGHSH